MIKVVSVKIPQDIFEVTVEELDRFLEIGAKLAELLPHYDKSTVGFGLNSNEEFGIVDADNDMIRSFDDGDDLASWIQYVQS